VLYSLRKVKERPKKGAVRDFFFFMLLLYRIAFFLYFPSGLISRDGREKKGKFQYGRK
jgi:hypothetical protein